MDWPARLQLLTKACFLTICISVIVYILRSYIFAASQISHLGMVNFRILHVQIWQASRLLFVSRFNPVMPLRRFTLFNRKILLNLTKANHCYGHALFVFLVLNIPTNCHLLISVATGQVVTPINYCYAFNAVFQFVAILGIHVVIAELNSYFLSSNPKFYNCMLRSTRFTALRELLRFSLYFQAFHSKKRYGFSYSRFGRISKLSFTKVDRLKFK